MPLPALRLPALPIRRRPPDLVYAAGERPPLATLLVLGAQHAATAMAFIAYVLVTARMAGLDRWGTQSMVAMTLLGMALCTALQAWGGRWGSGALLVHMPNPFMIAFGAALVAAHGLGGMAAAALVYGLVALAMAPLVRHMRALFPPPVVGVVICMGGMALVSSSVRHALGVGEGQWHVDGASALVLMTAAEAAKRGLKPLAKIVAHATQSQDPSEFTIAPIGAMSNLFKKTGWSKDDVDLYEINEAFAMVTMLAMREHGLDHAKVNVYGGACAQGHPVGSTGSRLIVTLINALQRKGGKRGVASLCIGGGEATAVAIELL